MVRKLAKCPVSSWDHSVNVTLSACYQHRSFTIYIYREDGVVNYAQWSINVVSGDSTKTFPLTPAHRHVEKMRDNRDLETVNFAKTRVTSS